MTHNSYPLSLAQISRTREHCCSTPPHYAFTPKHWFDVAVCQLAQLCLGFRQTNRDQQSSGTAQDWLWRFSRDLRQITLAHRCNVSSSPSVGWTVAAPAERIHLNTSMDFWTPYWSQQSWESDLQAEQVDYTAVLGQENRKYRKCLMNSQQHNTHRKETLQNQALLQVSIVSLWDR